MTRGAIAKSDAVIKSGHRHVIIPGQQLQDRFEPVEPACDTRSVEVLRPAADQDKGSSLLFVRGKPIFVHEAGLAEQMTAGGPFDTLPFR
jgi:hypothetical protein